MCPRLLIAEPRRFSARALAALQTWAHVEQREVSGPELRRAFEEFDILWLRLAHRVEPGHLAHPCRTRILATPVTGLDHVDLDACGRAGVRVVSLRGEVEFLKTVRATAELTVGLALALLRRIPSAYQSVLAGAWERDLFQGGELYGKVAGVVGVGRLGRIVAGYFRAFGMEVIGYDPRPDFPDDLARRMPSLEALLAAADLVSLHVNYHPGTHHLINAAALARMKPGALLVNTSRGGVVDEPALAAALRSGRLAGAALDVVDGEPEVPADHVLLACARTQANLLLTPHIGGNTMESFEKTELFLATRVEQAWREACSQA